MGYRSEVTCAIAFDSKEKLAGFLAECKLDNVISKEYLDEYRVRTYEYAHVDRPHVYVLVALFHDIKWYDYFEDVSAHVSMLELAEAKEFPTCFIRLGEDTSDVEVITNESYDGNDFDFPWWEYGYEVERTTNIADGESELDIRTFFEDDKQPTDERSSDDEQRAETSES